MSHIIQIEDRTVQEEILVQFQEDYELESSKVIHLRKLEEEYCWQYEVECLNQ